MNRADSGDMINSVLTRVQNTVKSAFGTLVEKEREVRAGLVALGLARPSEDQRVEGALQNGLVALDVEQAALPQRQHGWNPGLFLLRMNQFPVEYSWISGTSYFDVSPMSCLVKNKQFLHIHDQRYGLSIDDICKFVGFFVPLPSCPHLYTY